VCGGAIGVLMIASSFRLTRRQSYNRASPIRAPLIENPKKEVSHAQGNRTQRKWNKEDGRCRFQRKFAKCLARRP
jgi:hypothetical protein